MIWSRHQPAQLLAWGIRFFLAAALTATQTPGDYAPFALGCVAACGPGAGGIAALLGAGVGAVLFLDFSGALPFLAAAILIFTTAAAFQGLKLLEGPLFHPLAGAGLFLAVSGIYVLQSLSPLRNLAPCLAATALVGISAWYYQPLLQAGGERPEPDSLLFLAGSILLALVDVELAGVSVGRSLLCLLLAYTASKKFGLPELEGMTIGAALLYPYLSTTSGMDISNLFGIPVVMPASGNYTSSVLPIVCAIAFAAWFEKKYKKFIPDSCKLFFVPLITCGVTFILTLWIIGPITSLLGDGLGIALNAIANFNGILLGAVVGGLWQILVMFGLHWATVPLMLNDLATKGYSNVLTGMFGCTFAQCGAVLAIYLKTKNSKTKSLCIPALISGIAGVTEPAIYGLTLPKKKPFIITCIVGAITGAALMAFNVIGYTSAGTGIFGYTAYINTVTNDISGMIASIVISLIAVVLAFMLVYVTYSDEPAKAKK